MSDQERKSQPAAQGVARGVPGPTRALRSLRPGEIGADRMNPIREERAAAVRQIEHTMKAWRSASGAAAGPARIPQGAGAALPAETRAKMEPKLGVNLDAVRVHAGDESATAARNLGARAFTRGEDVHFAQGQFAPGTREGDKLLAHELTHVAQGQRSGIQRKPDSGGEPDEKPEVSDSHEPAEQEADAVAEGVSEELEDEKGQPNQEAEPVAREPGAKLSAGKLPRKIYRDEAPEFGPQDARDPYTIEPNVDARETARLRSGVHSSVAISIAKSSPVEFIQGMRPQFNGGSGVQAGGAPAVDAAIVDWYTSLTPVSNWTGPQKPVVHPLAAGRLSSIVAATNGQMKFPGSPGHYQSATTSKEPGCSLHGVGLALDFEAAMNPMVMNKQLQALIQTIGGGSHKMELPPGAMGVIGKMGEGAEDKDPASKEGEAKTPEQQKQFEKSGSSWRSSRRSATG